AVLGRRRDQPEPLRLLDDSQPGRAARRVTDGREERDPRPRVENLSPPDDRAERQPTAERLPEQHEVGNDIRVLECEPTPGPPHPDLDLVNDQQDAVAVAE